MLKFLSTKLQVAMSFLFASVLFTACTNPFAQAKPAGLQVEVDGAKASVYLNGEYMDKTPFVDKNLEAGTYNLRLEPEDTSLAIYETTVTLYPSTLAALNWEFGKTPETSSGVLYEMEPITNKNQAQLSVMSIPDSTIVKINDISQGFTPVLADDITAGSHKVTVSLPSYLEQDRTVNIVNGFKMKMNVKLAKEGVDVDLVQTPATDSATATDSASVATTSAQSKRSALATQNDDSEALGTVTIADTPTGWLRVREASSTAGTEVGRVDVGESVRYFAKENGWYQIEYETGEKGWVSGQYVEEE